MRVDVDRPHHHLFLLGYDGGDVVDDAEVIIADDAQGGGVLRLALATPARLHYAVAEALAHLRGVGAVFAVNLYSARHGDKSEHVVAIDRVAAFRQREVYALEVLVYHEDVVRPVGQLLIGTLICELLSRACGGGGIQSEHEVAHLHIFVHHAVDVKPLVGNGFIEVADNLVAHLLCHIGYHSLLEIYLPVLQPSLQQFLCYEYLLCLALLQCQSQF